MLVLSLYYLFVALIVCIIKYPEVAKWSIFRQLYLSSIVCVAKRTWCVPLTMLFIYYNASPICFVSNHTLTRTTKVTYDGIYKKTMHSDISYTADNIRDHRDENENYLISYTDTVTCKTYNLFIPASDYYYTVDFENKISEIINDGNFLFVNIKITPDSNNFPIANKKFKKVLRDASNLLILVGSEDQLLYSSKEPIGEFLETQISSDNSSISIKSLGEDEAKNETVTAKNITFVNEISSNYISDNWGKDITFITTDGSTLTVNLNDSLKYVEDDNNYLVVEDTNIPTELHYKDDRGKSIDIRINNEVKVNMDENGGEG